MSNVITLDTTRRPRQSTAPVAAAIDAKSAAEALTFLLKGLRKARKAERKRLEQDRLDIMIELILTARDAAGMSKDELEDLMQDAEAVEGEEDDEDEEDYE